MVHHFVKECIPRESGINPFINPEFHQAPQTYSKNTMLRIACHGEEQVCHFSRYADCRNFIVTMLNSKIRTSAIHLFLFRHTASL